jgi:hypothetical protein
VELFSVLNCQVQDLGELSCAVETLRIIRMSLTIECCNSVLGVARRLRMDLLNNRALSSEHKRKGLKIKELNRRF